MEEAGGWCSDFERNENCNTLAAPKQALGNLETDVYPKEIVDRAPNGRDKGTESLQLGQDAVSRLTGGLLDAVSVSPTVTTAGNDEKFSPANLKESPSATETYGVLSEDEIARSSAADQEYGVFNIGEATADCDRDRVTNESPSLGPDLRSVEKIGPIDASSLSTSDTFDNNKNKRGGESSESEACSIMESASSPSDMEFNDSPEMPKPDNMRSEVKANDAQSLAATTRNTILTDLNGGIGKTEDSSFTRSEPTSAAKEVEFAVQHPHQEAIPSSKVFVFSSFDSMSGNCQLDDLCDYLGAKKSCQTEAAELFLHDLAYTLGKRRSVMPFKSAFCASTVNELIQKLQSGSAKFVHTPKTCVIGFCFTGQGAQWHGMGRELLRSYSAFQDSIKRSSQLLESFGAKWDLIGTSLSLQTALS